MRSIQTSVYLLFLNFMKNKVMYYETENKLAKTYSHYPDDYTKNKI